MITAVIVKRSIHSVNLDLLAKRVRKAMVNLLERSVRRVLYYKSSRKVLVSNCSFVSSHHGDYSVARLLLHFSLHFPENVSLLERNKGRPVRTSSPLKLSWF